MGFNILKASPLSIRTTQPTFPKLHFSLHSFPNCFAKSNFTVISSRPVFHSISASGFGGPLRQSKRSFRRGGVIAMAAPGSVQKSEEDWRAILSPEQFRILRQKGTDHEPGREGRVRK
uniref:MsrB domain-containing protein n=1 Tax=Rhizophora mucronata TaxID=61149 RepID=A0A2P2JSJ0_RHIMU